MNASKDAEIKVEPPDRERLLGFLFVDFRRSGGWSMTLAEAETLTSALFDSGILADPRAGMPDPSDPALPENDPARYGY